MSNYYYKKILNIDTLSKYKEKLIEIVFFY